MGDLTLTNLDRSILDLLASRAAETGRDPDDIAREAVLKGLLWSPAERTAAADAIRDMTSGPLEDSTDLVRRLRSDQ